MTRGRKREKKKKNQRNQKMSKMYKSSFAPQSAIHLGGIDCIFCTQPTNREKKKKKNRHVKQWGVQMYYQHRMTTNNTTHKVERQVLGKWFNIGDRSKKLHHTITYVTKISLTVSTTRLCSQWGQKNQKKLWSKQQKSKPLTF